MITPIEQIPIGRLREECKYFGISYHGLSRSDIIIELKSKGLEDVDTTFPAKPPKIDTTNRIDDLSNVFIGNGAGNQEHRSNQLYIANSDTVNPLIGGDFKKHTINISYVLNVKEDSNIGSSIVNITGNEGDIRRIGSTLYMFRSTHVHPGWYPIKFEPVIVI